MVQEMTSFLGLEEPHSNGSGNIVHVEVRFISVHQAAVSAVHKGIILMAVAAETHGIIESCQTEAEVVQVEGSLCLWHSQIKFIGSCIRKGLIQP